MPLVINGLRGVHTHTYTHTFADESNYRKTGTRRPAAGAPGLKT